MSSVEEVQVVIGDALACLVVEAISLEAELPGAVEGAVEQVQLPWSNAAMPGLCQSPVAVCSHFANYRCWCGIRDRRFQSDSFDSTGSARCEESQRPRHNSRFPIPDCK